MNLSTLQQEMGDIDGAVRSAARYLEAVPDDREGWHRLASLYRSCNNALGEMHARLALAELPDIGFDELSSAASRLNGLLSRKEIQLDADERRLMVRKFRALMEDQHKQADATDLSRLAWLCLHDHDRSAAERWTSAGLTLDPQNEHCLRLQQRLLEG
jgi:conjugal transfer/entry exclusion protein